MVSYPIRPRSQHSDPGIHDRLLQLISSEEARSSEKPPVDKTHSLVSLATLITVRISPYCFLICTSHQWRQSHLQGLCPNTLCLPQVLSDLQKEFTFLQDPMATMLCKSRLLTSRMRSESTGGTISLGFELIDFLLGTTTMVVPALSVPQHSPPSMSFLLPPQGYKAQHNDTSIY